MNRETEIADAPMVPPLAQYAVYEAFLRSVRLYVAYGVLMGYIRVV